MLAVTDSAPDGMLKVCNYMMTYISISRGSSKLINLCLVMTPPCIKP